MTRHILCTLLAVLLLAAAFPAAADDAACTLFGCACTRLDLEDAPDEYWFDGFTPEAYHAAGRFLAGIGASVTGWEETGENEWSPTLRVDLDLNGAALTLTYNIWCDQCILACPDEIRPEELTPAPAEESILPDLSLAAGAVLPDLSWLTDGRETETIKAEMYVPIGDSDYAYVYDDLWVMRIYGITAADFDRLNEYLAVTGCTADHVESEDGILSADVRWKGDKSVRLEYYCTDDEMIDLLLPRFYAFETGLGPFDPSDERLLPQP